MPSAAPAPPPRVLTAAPWHPSYLAGRAFGTGMRLVPRRHRFGVAARLAATLAVPMRALPMFRGLRRALRLNSGEDLSLHLLLRAMTASATPFEVPLRLEGGELLRAALTTGRGTVLVSPHALLSRLLLRHLYDLGQWPTVIGGMDSIPVTGTRVALPTLKPSPQVLLLARRRLREGGIVCANVDRISERAAPSKTLRFDTAVGEMRLSDSIFQLALRCQAQVLFTIARAEPGGVRQWIAAPGASAQSPHAIAREFAAFVRQHTDNLSPG